MVPAVYRERTSAVSIVVLLASSTGSNTATMIIATLRRGMSMRSQSGCSAYRSGTACVFLISFDYPLHHSAANYIITLEFDKANPRYGVQNGCCVNKTTGSISRKINLSDISGHYRCGVLTDSSQEHLHLFRGGILRFIEYDTGVVQRTATHIGKRCSLDRTIVLQPFNDRRRNEQFHGII